VKSSNKKESSHQSLVSIDELGSVGRKLHDNRYSSKISKESSVDYTSSTGVEKYKRDKYGFSLDELKSDVLMGSVHRYNFRSHFPVNMMNFFISKGISPEALMKEAYHLPIVFPWNIEYDFLRQVFNRRFNNYPLAIVMCKKIREVQKIFTFIRSYGLRFVLRSGSSSTESLYANEKVVIDLSGVNHIEILKKCKLVPKSEEELRKSSASKFSCDDGKCDHSGLLRVGAGCLVGPTTEFLQESGYQLPIATLGHLSLLGLAINGGIGEFSREFGLLSDNIVAFYVLLPSEKIVRVDPKDNPDLF